MSGALAIVVAAGGGERLGLDVPKALVEISGRTILELAVDAAVRCADVSAVIAVVPGGRERQAAEILAGMPATDVVTGGSNRHASVRAALDAAVPIPARVVCHDAARPFASPALFASVLAGLDRWDAVVPALAVADTVKRVRDGAVVATEPRDELMLAQTPQAFRGPALVDAHDRAADAGVEFTDDAACLEWTGYRVGVVAGEPGNFKITTPEDLRRAEVSIEAARG